MKKKYFFTLIIAVVGMMLFSLGMCMCLLPEWGVFKEGLVVGLVGALLLLITVIACCRMLGIKAPKLSVKTIGKIIYGIISVLVFGTGMCMVLAFDMMIVGIIVGIAGIVMCLCLIPMCVGLK